MMKTKVASRKTAGLTRMDYAMATCRVTRPADPHAPDLDLIIDRPQQVGVAMKTTYAKSLLGQLRGAEKPRRGECMQICIDCPVEITLNAASLELLIHCLEREVGAGQTRQVTSIASSGARREAR